MKQFITLLLLSVFTTTFWAGDVNLTRALSVAKTHIAAERNVSRSIVQTQLVNQKQYRDASGQLHTAYYVLSVNQNQGFVIVAGDDKSIPVLGYTDKGAFDESNLPNGLKKLLFNYAKEIKHIAEDYHVYATPEIRSLWNDLENGIIKPQNRSSVAPLTQTEWSQSSGGYNILCPGGTPTGCVATATAQIMKYHNHPQVGNGSHSYNHTTYGTLSANFGATTYQWSVMPNALHTNSSTQAEKEAIGTLMFHIGVALEMNYSPGSSGAFSRDVPDVLKTYFSYDNSAQFIKRSHYSLASWKNKIKTDLDVARVVYHSGFCPNPQAGHAFVIDGYDANDKFHVNWGWGGYANGYFEINNLNPGSTYTFNSAQSAIIKIKPLAQNVDLRLFGSITVSSTTIPFNSPFSVSADIANYGNLTYNGSIKAALFDQNDAFVGNIETQTGVTIPANDYVSLTFNTQGMNTPPGNYKLGIYIQNTNNNTWVLATPDGYTNPLSISINGTNPQGLISNSNILVNPDPIDKDQPFQVEFEILNNNATDFSGDISIDLHEINGDWVTEIDHGTYNIVANGTQYIVYNHSGLSNEPGTYKLVIWHKPTGGQWEIIADGNYPNSVTVDIIGQNFITDIPDSYEDNNTEANAYNIPTNWTNGEFNFATSGANIHSITADSNDFYQMELEAGFSYKIYARVHDNYTAQAGMFTNDVVFKVFDGANWSNFYDDTEMDTLSIPYLTANKTLLFDVVPFFYNELGTYQLEITAVRMGAVGINEEENGALNIYPNPCNNVLTIENTNDIRSIQLLDIQGKSVSLPQNKINGNIIKLDVSTLKNGMYMLLVTDKNATYTKQVTVFK